MRQSLMRIAFTISLIVGLHGSLEAQDEFNPLTSLRDIKRLTKLCTNTFRAFIKVSKDIEEGDEVSDQRLAKLVENLRACGESALNMIEDTEAAIAELEDQEGDPDDEDGDDGEDTEPAKSTDQLPNPPPQLPATTSSPYYPPLANGGGGTFGGNGGGSGTIS